MSLSYPAILQWSWVWHCLATTSMQLITAQDCKFIELLAKCGIVKKICTSGKMIVMPLVPQYAYFLIPVDVRHY
jgi:hypothetical protein